MYRFWVREVNPFPKVNEEETNLGGKSKLQRCLKKHISDRKQNKNKNEKIKEALK